MAVYFIAEDENGNYDCLRIKIGISKNVPKRLAQLSTGSPYKLKLMGWINTENDRDFEKSLHQKYLENNVHLEWFELGVCDVLDELKFHSVNSHISVNDNAFEVVARDRNGVPECVGSWQWTEVDNQEFCPNCGWGGGLDYNENFGCERCLQCGFCENHVVQP
ncbi:GIY-YIG nuclease family protein [Vibrio sp. RE86]|uniref:GIY-YIG nuclease family protein n=1 Tax=Vibrio sp. RE86 TaxID=2607605 RepID=UPI001493D890|nr:GIY-YIG nuclease family protein [Vibrio sp. RE86]NOH82111.1 GIY-YIG nuclease family protein [Vibrio sp. RE86]